MGVEAWTGPQATPAPPPPDGASESETYQLVGKNLLNSLLTGTAVGAGGMGLWHLAKKIKKKYESETAPASIDSLALAPPARVSRKYASEDSAANLLRYPLAGAGIGALVGALRAGKKKRLAGALAGAGVGSAVGLGANALTTKNISELVGKGLPHSLSRGNWFGGGEMPSLPSGTYQAAYNLGMPIAAGAGAYAGGSAVHSMLKEDTAGNRDAVRSARNDYFRELLSDNDEEEKTAFSSSLDVVYLHAEKAARDGDHFDAGTLGEGWKDYVSGPAQTLMGLSLLAGGTYGAKYMYDKTREKSDAKLLSAAQQARARLNQQAPWVDPVELAHIKAIVAKNRPTNARGV